MTDAAPRVTYADLWDLADRERQRHQLWADVSSARVTEAGLAGDPSAVDCYFRAQRDHTALAEQFAAMQKLIGRVERSKIMREELKRISDIERAEAAASALAVDEAEEAQA